MGKCEREGTNKKEAMIDKKTSIEDFSIFLTYPHFLYSWGINISLEKRKIKG